MNTPITPTPRTVPVIRPRAYLGPIEIWVLALWVVTLAEPLAAEWSAVAEHRTSYTSDAFQFSKARRLSFAEDPSLPTGLDVEQEQDVIWEPSLELIRSFSTDESELSIKGRGFLYTLNPIFNHADLRLQGKRNIGAHTSLLVRYRYVPNLFLGPNFERRTGQRLIENERVTTHRGRMELEHRFTDRWRGTLVGRYGIRLFNDAFAERDTKFWTLGPKVDWIPVPWMTITVGYLYERGLAVGRDQPELADDVSYHLHHLSVGTALDLSARLSLNLIYTYQHKDFSSDFLTDTHRGRLDQIHQGIAEVVYRLTSTALLTIAVQQTQRTSTFALRNFNDTIVSIGGAYRF